ncbi:protein STPG4-like [Tubulanus polymorphus]|uniref:protein STPG4-like n=1 Tax=Tubulanus polymorphus TaxID=672921 RepID=UPI003DA21CA3
MAEARAAATVTVNSASTQGSLNRSALAASPPLMETNSSRADYEQKAQITAVKISPKQARHALKENYEDPVSNRENWWRCTIRETPVPGAYEVQDFITLYNKNPIKQSYRFKSDGRRRDPNPHGKGATLLPGAYNRKDFIEELETLPLTYNFKSTGRKGKDLLNRGIKDKDINVSPNKYPIENYLSMTAERLPSKHMVFKSQQQRFPTIYFRPKDGPPPGAYEPRITIGSRCVSSSFKSKTPRFRSPNTKVPGPGTYEKTNHVPMPNTIAKMGRQHGLFFSSAFET